MHRGYKYGLEERWMRLADLLGYTMDWDEAVAAVRRMHMKYGTLPTILAENPDQLCEFSGLDMSQVLLLKLLGYVHSRSVTDGFELGVPHTEAQIVDYIRALYVGVDVESVHVLFLDDSDTVIGCTCMGAGTVMSSEIYPRAILAQAVREGASAVILAHNHPKGFPTPSNDDIEATRVLKQMLSVADICLAAHYIVADGSIGRVDL